MTLHIVVAFRIVVYIGGLIEVYDVSRPYHYDCLVQICLIASVDGLETLVFMIVDNIIGTDYLTEKE